jgi:hypothetical protein
VTTNTVGPQNAEGNAGYVRLTLAQHDALRHRDEGKDPITMGAAELRALITAEEKIRAAKGRPRRARRK